MYAVQAHPSCTTWLAVLHPCAGYNPACRCILSVMRRLLPAAGLSQPLTAAVYNLCILSHWQEGHPFTKRDTSFRYSQHSVLVVNTGGLPCNKERHHSCKLHAPLVHPTREASHTNASCPEPDQATVHRYHLGASSSRVPTVTATC